MKLALATVAFLATIAIAAPTDSVNRGAEPDAWCERPGQSCWKDKRAPEAVPEAAERDSNPKA
ncbi:hypothetical protein GMORB2_0764 [Geosmithia morbida]|uniref:Uncharacterized protein n=1 Tax=Geosmithia morbida TaxID=1094350 RepID=A0A9P4Z1L5_9HYPO|nr:uncharacterized protein GMORB2_0764 [Geosmithia morbida]KAF4127026.1 hypothetical protein GMORB2_0764 [Geosmithia morbida]